MDDTATTPASRRRTPIRLTIGAAAAILLVATTVIAHDVYSSVKTSISETLVANAWSRALDGEYAPKPWPWADLWPVARLAAPTQGKSVIVLSANAGATDAATVLTTLSPPQGADLPVIIAAHDDERYDFLRQSTAGEDLLLETPRGLRRYEIVRIGLMNPQTLAAISRAPMADIVIADEAKYENVLQPIVRDWREEGTRFKRLSRIVEVPLFVDSSATELIQVADYVAHAVYRSYHAGDDDLLARMARAFDRSDGKLHGLVHLTPDHRTCACRACMSRNRRSRDSAP